MVRMASRNPKPGQEPAVKPMLAYRCQPLANGNQNGLTFADNIDQRAHILSLWQLEKWSGGREKSAGSRSFEESGEKGTKKSRSPVSIDIPFSRNHAQKE